jgi:hypothetical protein
MSRPVPVLADVGRAIRPVALAREQVVLVLPELLGLVPDGGLVRGSVTVVEGDGAATSLALALVAGPSAAGSWTAVVGCPWLGLAAAAEAGVALERLALVAEPEPADWAGVVAALVGAVDVVVVGPTHRVRTADARRLAARARERGTVLVQLPIVHGRDARRAKGQVGLEADLRLTVVEARWQGVGRGHGHVQARRISVEVGGRRRADQPRRVELWCPDPRGGVALIPSPQETGNENASKRRTKMPSLRGVGERASA